VVPAQQFSHTFFLRSVQHTLSCVLGRRAATPPLPG
jgi:hypothetical protein